MHSVVEVAAGQAFTFKPAAKLDYGPSKWSLDYLLVYLWHRTEHTPKFLWTPMDVYREAIEGHQKEGR